MCLSSPAVPGRAGQLVWRRHAGRSGPSRHAIRATCMELLPLVEMHCKFELQEDCSNLRALMLRFDSEAALRSHDLGRALLQMMLDDDAGLEMPAHRLQFEARVNPFDAIRDRISAVDLAFQGLQPQVLVVLVCTCDYTNAGMRMAAYAVSVLLFSMLCATTSFQCKSSFGFHFCPHSVCSLFLASLLFGAFILRHVRACGLHCSLCFGSMPSLVGLHASFSPSRRFPLIQSAKPLHVVHCHSRRLLGGLDFTFNFCSTTGWVSLWQPCANIWLQLV